ncbi:CHAT domain-containing protein [Nocardiopsis sp. NPDC058631]|uniref:CHAT domain-containing protein n=1 Tax=Nocardiopsis sp. NPDC058631 TaxID=3346566 RepID=UPI00365519D2
MSLGSPPAPAASAAVRRHGDRVSHSGGSLLSRVTHGVRLAQDGRFEETVDLLTDTRLRLSGHPVADAAQVMPGVLVNLGLAQILCGRFGQAEDHLREALSLTQERGLPLLGMVADQNLGCLSLYRGDASSAIATFHALSPRLPASLREALQVDLAEALLAEGLVEEAAEALADGPWADGRSTSASTLLVEAKLRLLRGDHRRAVELTGRVRHGFGRGSLWYRLASRLEHRALREARPRPPSPVERAANALAARVPLAVTAREGRSARHEVLASLPSAGGPPAPRAARTAEDPHVVRAGLESALASGDASAALEWAELARTWAVPRVPGPLERAPEMAALAEGYRDALVHDRDADAAARRWESARWYTHHTTRAAVRPDGAWFAGSAGPRRTTPPPAADTAPQPRPVRRPHPGTPDPAGPRPVTGPLLERLGDRAFLRYTRAAGDAVVLIATDGRVHCRVLGPLPQVAQALSRFVHPLLVPGRPPGAAAREAANLATRALLGPVLPLVGDRPLVVASDPYLGDPPWGMLPALRGRPVNLVPTARFWLDRHGAFRTGAPRPRRVLLVAAPEPDGAVREVAQLTGLYPGASVLTGDRARRGDVLDGIGQADLVHLAGHGHVPARSPMLSSVGLADGPLLACDLASLSGVPDVVALSTCWSGRDFAGRAGAPLGFAGALLAAGAHTVVASPVPVGDSGTGEAMRRFHRALAGGVPAPEAVAVHLGRVGFCCFGA